MPPHMSKLPSGTFKINQIASKSQNMWLNETETKVLLYNVFTDAHVWVVMLRLLCCVASTFTYLFIHLFKLFVFISSSLASLFIIRL